MNPQYYTKYSRKLKTAYVFTLTSGSEIYVERIGGLHGGRPRTQICENGSLRGETIHSTDKNFKSIVNRWYRQHIKNQ